MLKIKTLNIITFTIVSLLFAVKISFAGDQNDKTNKDIIQIIIHEILENSLKSAEPENVFYLQKQKNEKEVFIESIILEYLKSENKRVIFSKNIYETDTKGSFLEIKCDKIEINYKKSKNDTYERNINIELNVKIIDIETKELKFIKNFNKYSNDLITKNMAAAQLNLKESFLKGTLIENKGLKKILEPALVIISSSIIAYLFYSIRSR